MKYMNRFKVDGDLRAPLVILLGTPDFLHFRPLHGSEDLLRPEVAIHM